jgi:hypothetical protein
MKTKIGAAALGGLLLVSPLAAQTLCHWGPLLEHAEETWPEDLKAVHMVHIRGGYILIWGGSQSHESPESTFVHVFNAYTRQFVPEPSEGQFTVNADLFCAGHTHLPGGNLLVIGGDAEPEVGIKDVYEFSWSSLSWTRRADMIEPRWYPTATLLKDGRVLATGGQRVPDGEFQFVKEPEGWNPLANAWTRFEPVPLLEVPLYPFMFSFHDVRHPTEERVFYAGKQIGYTSSTRTWQTYSLHVPPSGSAAEWEAFGNAFELYGSGAVMWIPQTHPLHAGYVFKFGGPGPEQGNFNNATKKGAKINLNDNDPVWTATADMIEARAECNLVVLPDGRIAAIGGSGRREPNTWWRNDPVMNAEYYDVETNTWIGVTPQMARPRMYHSTAILLPTGHILTAGGERENVSGDPPDTLNAQVLHPYYFAPLYSAPLEITGTSPALTMQYDDILRIDSKRASEVTQVSLIKLGAATHGFDMSQRYIRMTIQSQDENSVYVYTPKNAGIAPPGDYMLFIVSGMQISVARYMRIE